MEEINNRFQSPDLISTHILTTNPFKMTYLLEGNVITAVPDNNANTFKYDDIWDDKGKTV